jgi:hypothetical protein
VIDKVVEALYSAKRYVNPFFLEKPDQSKDSEAMNSTASSSLFHGAHMNTPSLELSFRRSPTLRIASHESATGENRLVKLHPSSVDRLAVATEIAAQLWQEDGVTLNNLSKSLPVPIRISSGI